MSLNSMITLLEILEQETAELLVDEQDTCEDRGDFSPGWFTGDDDNIPICLPEHASPELDGARTFIRDAIELLEEWRESRLEHKKVPG